MFTKIIILVQFAALVGCPLRCIAWSHAAATVAPVAPRCCCCKHHQSQQETTNPRREIPADSPDDQPCQGICGGAVTDGARPAVAPDDHLSPAVDGFAVAIFKPLAERRLGARFSNGRERALHPRRIACLYAVWRC